jgi:hypothetical protein
MNLSRILLALSALILVAASFIHASAYKKMTVALAASNLPPFYAQCLKGLWLIDAATLLLIAIIFAAIAVQPALASRPMIILIALVPAATALLLYRFLGSFPAAHVLLAAAAAAIIASLVAVS